MLQADSQHVTDMRNIIGNGIADCEDKTKPIK